MEKWEIFERKMVRRCEKQRARWKLDAMNETWFGEMAGRERRKHFVNVCVKWCQTVVATTNDLFTHKSANRTESNELLLSFHCEWVKAMPPNARTKVFFFSNKMCEVALAPLPPKRHYSQAKREANLLFDKFRGQTSGCRLHSALCAPHFSSNSPKAVIVRTRFSLFFLFFCFVRFL